MITDVNENRLLQARNLGADVAFHPASEPVENRVMKETDGKGADLVIISVGSSAFKRSISSCCKRWNDFGLCSLSERGCLHSSRTFFHDEVKVVGAYSSHPYHYREALELLKAKVVHTEKW